MKIKEVAERDCCNDKDLIPIDPTIQPSNVRVNRQFSYVFCKHCGRHYERDSHFNGVETEYYWKALKWPWQK